jgi:hypothetical protein
MLRRFARALVPAAAACFMLVFPTGAHAEGAVVIRGDDCSLFAADGNLFQTNNTQIVLTFSEQGNSKISCKAWQPSNVPKPDQAVIFNYANTGVVCGTGRDLTMHWSSRVTPSGRAILTCVFNPSGG